MVSDKPLTDAEIARIRAVHANPILHVENVTEIASAIPRLLDEVDRARALLKRIEWSANDGFECPACGEYNTHTVGKPPPPHKPGCELAALIGGK